jgi:hypothetical protein
MVTLPGEVEKLVPIIATLAPTTAADGERLEMLGGGVTVKVTPVLDCPATVTTTGPVVAVPGTTAFIEVELQVEMVALSPLNVTLPCTLPKLLPSILTCEPTAPELGVREEILGGGAARGNVICESKLPFRVPSMSISPLKLVDEVPVRFTPVQR